ncbi:hypothetical protein O3G_MSEX006587 [Manduca sexta]|uniref:Uncharacterized protein n=1 Tax=Manduca sexta TaxID=7130 RepID=A0A922CL75_MANSE|nr:hypothetical protein O3G_MSEX006587 [Manduca sexta]
MIQIEKLLLLLMNEYKENMFCLLVFLLCVTIINAEKPLPESSTLKSTVNTSPLSDKSEIIHDGNVILNGDDSNLNDNNYIGVQKLKIF